MFLVLRSADKANKGTSRVTMYEKLSMGMGKPIPAPLPNLEDYTVEFDGVADSMHPYNWKRSTKYVSFC